MKVLRALSSIPIFPLPEVVLFPGGQLPLHVFEPRYRTMLEDCLKTHGALVLAMLVDGDTCLGGVCKLTPSQYRAVNYAPAHVAQGEALVQKGLPWWAEDKGGKWNNDLSSKPAAVNQNCNTFKGGVPLGTYTGVPQIAGVAQQPEYLIEFMDLRNQRPCGGEECSQFE